MTDERDLYLSAWLPSFRPLTWQEVNVEFGHADPPIFPYWSLTPRLSRCWFDVVGWWDDWSERLASARRALRRPYGGVDW